MNGELKKMIDQAKALWAKLPTTSRMVVVLVVLGSIAGSAYLGLKGPTESWAVLFSGLQSEDAAKVVEQLKADNTPYRISANDTIEVPAARVHELRLSMAGAGLPRGGGVGFELFDKQAFGTTSFVEQMNYRRALQGELARTIMSLDAVERARVHIAAPERSLYKEDDDAPTASVVLTLKGGHKLSNPQVRGVVHLVAASIAGLKPERVTVVDEQGTPLWSGEDSGTGVEASADLEHTLNKRVREIVERVVGVGHAQVEVTAELDESRAERTEDIYDKDKIALRSESKTEERTGAADANSGGVAGARGNLPGAAAPSATPSGDSGRIRLSETHNYEVNHVVSRVVQPKSRVKRIHVAVLVDEATDPKGGHKPRTTEELTRIGALARAAAGLEEERGDKIEVAQAPFAPTIVDAGEPEKPALKLPKWAPLAAGGAGLLVIIIAFMLLRRKRPIAPEIVRALPAPVERLEATLAARPEPAAELPASASSRERALQAARGDTTRAARVLSSWMNEGHTAGKESAS